VIGLDRSLIEIQEHRSKDQLPNPVSEILVYIQSSPPLLPTFSFFLHLSLREAKLYEAFPRASQSNDPSLVSCTPSQTSIGQSHSTPPCPKLRSWSSIHSSAINKTYPPSNQYSLEVHPFKRAWAPSCLEVIELVGGQVNS